jgi:hypothetical protein
MADKRHGPSQLHYRLAPDTKFEDIVKHLEVALTIPDIGRFKGCAPCLSGLDRFVFEDPALNDIARLQGKAGQG